MLSKNSLAAYFINDILQSSVFSEYEAASKFKIHKRIKEYKYDIGFTQKAESRVPLVSDSWIHFIASYLAFFQL